MEVTGLGLHQVPIGLVLETVMTATERSEITVTGRATRLPAVGVVEVAGRGGAWTSREAAGRIAAGHVLGQRHRRPVASAADLENAAGCRVRDTDPIITNPNRK